METNSFDVFSKLIFDKIERINKDLKYFKLTFHDICPCDMTIIINKSNKPFCHIYSQCVISTTLPSR